MRNSRKTSLVLIILGAVVLLVASQGVFMKSTYTRYEGSGFSFEYPKSWTLRESKGSVEKYFQVHIFGKIDPGLGFGPSITLTVYPKKTIGGVFGDPKGLIERQMSNRKERREYRLVFDRQTALSSAIMAQDIQVNYSMALPLYAVSYQDTPVMERSLFFERASTLYVLSYANLSKHFATSLPVFKKVIRTLRF